MNECSAISYAIATTALAVAATALAVATFVIAYIAKTVKSWRKWQGDEKP